ncbi:MAG TPA: radical SAM protein [Terriglobia bacterium]|nr:radical SAM protein [Terriglobia bacterium]
MKIALVRGRWHSVWESLACGYLYSYTKALADEYVFLDGYFETDEEIISRCLDADIVGFSGTTSQMSWNIEIASAVKRENPRVWIVMGGYGPSAQPTQWRHWPIDSVVIGEGESSWSQILQGRRDEVIFSPPIMDLDSIPFPDRDFIRVERCIQIAKREEGRRVTSVLGNRGCLRRCKFCLDGTPSRNLPQPTIYGAKLRERSPANIADEMKQVVTAHNIEFLKFADPEVNSRPGRIKELADELVGRGWSTPWGGNFLVNPFDERDAEMLFKAGCREVWFGLESGSREILKSIGKGTNVATTRRAFKAARDAGLRRRAYVLMGTPLETLETIRQTESLIDEVRPDTVSFSVLAPYPGTEYYDDRKHSALEWHKTDEYSGGVSLCSLSPQELDHERQRLLNKYRGDLSLIMKKKVALGVISTDEIPFLLDDDFKIPWQGGTDGLVQ